MNKVLGIMIYSMSFLISVMSNQWGVFFFFDFQGIIVFPAVIGHMIISYFLSFSCVCPAEVFPHWEVFYIGFYVHRKKKFFFRKVQKL